MWTRTVVFFASAAAVLVIRTKHVYSHYMLQRLDASIDVHHKSPSAAFTSFVCVLLVLSVLAVRRSETRTLLLQALLCRSGLSWVSSADARWLKLFKMSPLSRVGIVFLCVLESPGSIPHWRFIDATASPHMLSSASNRYTSTAECDTACVGEWNWLMEAD